MVRGDLLTIWVAPESGDVPKFRKIAREIAQQFPLLQATCQHSGGGIHGIYIPIPGTNPDDGQHLFWGTANDEWGADIVGANGEVKGNLEIPVPYDHKNYQRVAEDHWVGVEAGDRPDAGRYPVLEGTCSYATQRKIQQGGYREEVGRGADAPRQE